MHTRTRHLLAAALALLAPFAVAVTWLLLRGDLPDPMPTHWDLRGRVDDTLPTGILLLVALASSLLLAALATWLVRPSARQPGYRAFAAGLVWAAWLPTAVFSTTTLLAAGADEAADVSLAWWALLAVPLLPTLVAAAAAAVLPAARPAVLVGAATAPYRGTLRLGATERVTWLGSSSSRSLLVVAAVLELAAVVLVFTVWPVANLLALVGVVAFWVHTVTVRVDDRGLSAAWGPARWPRVHVDLADVVDASAEDVEPLAWGGWGYRTTPKGTGVVARRGPGIVVERRSGRRIAVTVDDAAAGAEVLAALVERGHRTTRA